MRRALALLVLALLLAGCNREEEAPDAGATPPTATTPATPSPPPPPEPPAAGAVRVAVNDSWRYRGGTNESPEEVFARVVFANDTIVRLRTTTTALQDNTTTATVSTLLADTLAFVDLEDGRLGVRMRFDPPLAILIPAEDHAWNGTISVPSPFGQFAQPANATIRFHGLESIEVPAGTFDTFRYEAFIHTEGAVTLQQHLQVWFSGEVGQAVRTITDGRVQELVSYERAGDAAG